MDGNTQTAIWIIVALLAFISIMLGRAYGVLARWEGERKHQARLEEFDANMDRLNR